MKVALRNERNHKAQFTMKRKTPGIRQRGKMNEKIYKIYDAFIFIFFYNTTQVTTSNCAAIIIM
jgi:hypothetical protein